MTTSTYLKPADREAQLLAAAMTLSEKIGYQAITREQVAALAQCSPALINHYFGSMDGLRLCVVRAAVQGKVLRIIAQAVINRHAAVRGNRCPVALREMALAAARK